MMEYPKRFRLGQKGTIGYQEHANNCSTDQTNNEGKVCSECSLKCSPSNNFCSLCVKRLKEI